MTIRLGCINTRENSQISERVSNTKDTLIYSTPQNYSKTLKSNDPAINFEVGNYRDMIALYEKLNYTPEAWWFTLPWRGKMF